MPCLPTPIATTTAMTEHNHSTNTSSSSPIAVKRRMRSYWSSKHWEGSCTADPCIVLDMCSTPSICHPACSSAAHWKELRPNLYSVTHTSLHHPSPQLDLTAAAALSSPPRLGAMLILPPAAAAIHPCCRPGCSCKNNLFLPQVHLVHGA